MFRGMPVAAGCYSIDDYAALVDRLERDVSRVLLIGRPGTGKSTLAMRLAAGLDQRGRSCHVVGVDPGNPGFGVPGAVCLGHWQAGAWRLDTMAALCSLDAGRFRLPLVHGVSRLLASLSHEPLLLDAPGVVRGMAGAELIPALCELAAIDLVLVMVPAGEVMPLAAELTALACEHVAVRSSRLARPPGKRQRARARTALWDAYLAEAVVRCLELDRFELLGCPPPRGVPEAWTGRQFALLAHGQTVAMGEIITLEDGCLTARLPAAASGDALLVRDAWRDPQGMLATAPSFATAPPILLPAAKPGPQMRTVSLRSGRLGLCLLNGVLGDPLLHLRPRHLRRSMLCDLGEGLRLSARVAHEVSDVFISHAHMDHLAGFVWLLRSRIDELPACRIFGPPGLAGHIAGLMRGFLWDRVGVRAPCFEVAELHDDCLLRYRLVAGRDEMEALPIQPARKGVILAENGFCIRAVALDHAGTPVLAFAYEPADEINIRKDRLRAMGLAPGPWLGELRSHIEAGRHDAVVRLPDGRDVTTRALAEDLVLVQPARRVVYATDLGDTPANRDRLTTLAYGAHTLLLEACFREQDAGRARATGHLTTRACSEIAAAAEVACLVPFHFSRRYEHELDEVYAELVPPLGRSRLIRQDGNGPA